MPPGGPVPNEAILPVAETDEEHDNAEIPGYVLAHGGIYVGTQGTLIPGIYVGAVDPGAVGAGAIWVSTAASPAVVKVRNAGNTAWV